MLIVFIFCNILRQSWLILIVFIFQFYINTNCAYISITHYMTIIANTNCAYISITHYMTIIANTNCVYIL